ncbi:hypothetical protein RN001_011729 [Aquatica leii]|uniref:Uncharacterized protein n=1 Tax=Aquatica leii TaxID=1421715 RepID=A0AAN7P2T4_9COLE|nr:hypothetical protein RN001_011729 [Aquatica leii]
MKSVARKSKKMQCLECGSKFDDNYQKQHENKKHSGKQVKVQLVVVPANPFEAAKKSEFKDLKPKPSTSTSATEIINFPSTSKNIGSDTNHPFPINQIEDVIADIRTHCGVTLLKNVCDELHEHLTPSTYSRSSLTSLPDLFHEVMDISCTCHDIQNTQICLEHVGCETVPDVNVKSVESSTTDDLSGPVDDNNKKDNANCEKDISNQELKRKQINAEIADCKSFEHTWDTINKEWTSGNFISQEESDINSSEDENFFFVLNGQEKGRTRKAAEMKRPENG